MRNISAIDNYALSLETCTGKWARIIKKYQDLNYGHKHQNELKQ